MQLTRYLLKQGIKLSHKKTDQVLEETVFSNIFESILSVIQDLEYLTILLKYTMILYAKFIRVKVTIITKTMKY